MYLYCSPCIYTPPQTSPQTSWPSSWVYGSALKAGLKWVLPGHHRRSLMMNFFAYWMENIINNHPLKNILYLIFQTSQKFVVLPDKGVGIGWRWRNLSVVQILLTVSISVEPRRDHWVAVLLQELANQLSTSVRWQTSFFAVHTLPLPRRVGRDWFCQHANMHALILRKITKQRVWILTHHPVSTKPNREELAPRHPQGIDLVFVEIDKCFGTYSILTRLILYLPWCYFWHPWGRLL